jgi:uroporphyrinogen-III synthase
MKSAFISRDINTSHPFYQILSSQGLAVRGISFIDFEIMEVKWIPKADWIFFYSKNGIHFFFENLKRQETSLSNLTYKWATIGSSSAKHLEKYGFAADFVGTGEPQTTALAFQPLAKAQRVIFPRAENSKQSIQKLLAYQPAHQMEAIDLLVYKNRIAENILKRNEDFLVFTSPMNAQAYFSQYHLDKQQQIIAIGTTTAAALKEFGLENIILAKQPNEEGLANAVLDFGL